MPQRDPVIGSRTVAREALARLQRQQPPVAPQLHERLQAIRLSLDHMQPVMAGAGEHGRASGPRLCVALASLPVGERRRAPRWPLIKPVMLMVNGLRLQATALDVGTGGVLLAPISFQGSDTIMAALVELSPGDHVAGTLSIDGAGFGHLAFEAGSAGSSGSLPRLLRACVTAYEPALSEAAALAGKMAWRMQALGADIVPPRHPSVKPPAEQSRPAARLEQALAPLLLDAMRTDPMIAYVAAVDAAGYVVGEIVRSNRAASRHGQYATDAVTLRAARFASQPIIQLHCRQPGSAVAGAFSEAAAPVLVGGRRWGCVQIGRAPLSYES